jgi:inorganic pyrophosphatase
VNAFIEITPFSLVKYEIDKQSGFLRVDRPQRGTSLPPTLYGFVPRTYCGERVSALCPEAERGHGDPLDVCVLSERPIDRAEVILSARVVGGLQMIDGGEADDKLVAVLQGDLVFGTVEDIDGLPPILVERLRHYFLTYKLVPGESAQACRIDRTYGREHAERVVEAAMADYDERYGTDGR